MVQDYLHRNCVQAKSFMDKMLEVSRIKLAPTDSNLPFSLHRVQFLLRLAYLVTINKAQDKRLIR